MKKFFSSTYFALIMLFLYIPIIVMMFFSFNSESSLSHFGGFSTKWYDEFIHNNQFLKSILTSLFVAVTSTIISIIIGVMACVGLAKLRPTKTNRLLGITNIPLVNADVISAVGLMVVFIIAGLKFGIFTLLASHVSFNVSYVIITVFPFAKKIDKNLLNAAQDLGSNRRQTFWKVVLPLLLPSILTAAAISFAMSFDDFIISYFNGGDQTNVSTFIYTAKRLQPYINAFGTILVLIIVSVILIWNIFNFVKNKKEETRNQIKMNRYKTSKFNQMYKELNSLYLDLHTESNLYKTKKFKLLFKYWKILRDIKILENKNYNAKISKLEWKKELIKEEIRKEKKLFKSFDKNKEKLNYLKNLLSKELDHLKKQKLTASIWKLEKKISKQEKQINLINQRKDNDKSIINEYDLEIKSMSQKLKNKKLSADEIKYLIKNISILKKEKEGLEEGRHKLKLIITIRKLENLKQKNINKLNTKWNELKEIKPKIYFRKSFAFKYDEEINYLNSIEQTEQTQQLIKKITKEKEEFILEEKEKITKKISNVENKISDLNEEVTIKKEKLFSNDNEEKPKRRTWIGRHWKSTFMGTIIVGSFALLTTAFVMNNTYSIVVGNWGSYIDPALITQFEKENKVKINYQQYDSNETLYNKYRSFSYDVMVPSDYMVAKFALEDKVEKIDWKKFNFINEPKELSETKKQEEQKVKLSLNQDLSRILTDKEINEIPNTSDTVLDYSVPYFWGDVRIVINTEKSENKELFKLVEKEGWNAIWIAANQNKKILLNEDQKNLLMISLLKDGKKNINPKNEKEIDDAIDNLIPLFKNKNVSLLGDQLIDKVSTGDFDIATIYNGDLIYAMNQYKTSSNLERAPFKLVESNITNVWSDNMVISKKNRNRDLAYKFVDFIAQNSKKLSSQLNITSPFEESMKEIVQENLNWHGDNFKFSDLYTPSKNGQSFKLNIALDDYITNKFNIANPPVKG